MIYRILVKYHGDANWHCLDNVRIDERQAELDAHAMLESGPVDDVEVVPDPDFELFDKLHCHSHPKVYLKSSLANLELFFKYSFRKLRRIKSWTLLSNR